MGPDFFNFDLLLKKKRSLIFKNIKTLKFSKATLSFYIITNFLKKIVGPGSIFGATDKPYFGLCATLLMGFKARVVLLQTFLFKKYKIGQEIKLSTD